MLSKVYRVFVFAFMYTIAMSSNVMANLDIKPLKSEKGYEIWFVEDNHAPVISISFSFLGGAAYDPKDKKGLTNAFVSMLTEGAGEYSSRQFREALKNHAIELDFSADDDRISGSMRTTKKNAELAFKLLREAIHNPQFDTKEFEKVKRSHLARLKNLETRPAYLAQKGGKSLLFADTAYEIMSFGNEAGVNNVEIEDLKTLKEGRFVTSTLIVGVCGDIKQEELLKLLDGVFGDLPKESGVKELDDIAPDFTGELYSVMRPFKQSVVYFSLPGLHNSHPDFTKLAVLNFVLGGGTTSRLNEEIREKRGMVYTVQTLLYNFDKASVWMGIFGTENAKVEKAIELVRAEWERLARDGVTAEELQNAKTYSIGSYPLKLSNSVAIAGRLHHYMRNKFSVEFVQERTKRIESLTLKELNEFAKKIFDQVKLSFIVVGEPEGLKEKKILFLK